MSKSGQNGYKGLLYQSKVALYLFLQSMHKFGFQTIQLEQQDSEDFDLIFNEKTYYCETKNFSKQLSLKQIQSILIENFTKKKITILKEDTILILAPKISKNVINNFKLLNYYNNIDIISHFEKKGFSKDEISLVKQVSFHQISDNEVDYLNKFLLNEWIQPACSDFDKKNILDLLVYRFFSNSKNGIKFSPADFKNFLLEYEKDILNRSSQSEKDVKYKITEIKDAARNPYSPKNSLNVLNSYTTTGEHYAYINIYFETLLEYENLDLANVMFDFDTLNLVSFTRSSHHVFEIFKKSIIDRTLSNYSKNIEFILSFLESKLKELKSIYVYPIFEINLFELINVLSNQDKIDLNKLYNLFELSINQINLEFFFNNSKKDKEYLLSVFSSALHNFYKKLQDSSHDELKEKVINLIFEKFSLITDIEESWRNTTKENFRIVKSYLKDSTDFEATYLGLVQKLSDQYQDFYKDVFGMKKWDGYDHIGGVQFSHGSEYSSVNDRKFVNLFESGLEKYYKQNPTKCLNFIFEIIGDCKVSKNKPDFILRSCILVLIEAYTEDNQKDKVLSILKKFIKSKDGIPSKREIIYDKLQGKSPKIAWEILKTDLNKKGPTSGSQAELVLKMFDKEPKAKKLAANWLSNIDFLKHFGYPFGNHVNKLITKFLIYDPQIATKSLNELLSLMGKGVVSRHDIDDLAELVFQLILNNYKQGTKILNDFLSQETLTKNQQSLVNFVISKAKTDNNDIFIKLFEELIIPHVLNLNDINKICKKYSESYRREQLVEFIEGYISISQDLVKIKSAFDYFKLFANDPSPDNNFDKDSDYDREMFSIETVRGKAAWYLGLILQSSKGLLIEDGIELLKKFLKDESFHVRRSVLNTFTWLCRYRYAYVDKDNTKLLFGKTEAEAITRAQLLEDFALDSFEELISNPKAIKLTKSYIQVFDVMRLLTFDKSKRLFNLLDLCDADVISKAIPSILYYTDLRKLEIDELVTKNIGLIKNTIEADFDFDYFAPKLKKLIIKHKHNEDIIKSLSYHLFKILESKENYSKFQPVFNKYLVELTSNYIKGDFSYIYQLVDKYIEDDINYWADVYLKCLRKELDFIEELKIKNPDSLSEYTWSPYYQNHEILSKIYSQNKYNEFAEAMDILSKYPDTFNIGIEKNNFSDYLKLNKKDKQEVINRFINRNPAWFVLNQV